jgi:hypothetical protein
MEVILKRVIKSNKAILGIMYLDGKELCRTLENPWLNNHSNISAIPEGEYICKAFSGKKYKNVWEITDVEGRTYVLIHNGNLEKHTEGCILVGKKWGFLRNELAVLSSVRTLRKLRKKLPSDFSLKIISE